MIRYLDGEVSKYLLWVKFRFVSEVHFAFCRIYSLKCNFFMHDCSCTVYIQKNCMPAIQSNKNRDMCCGGNFFSHPSIILQEERSRPCDFPMSTLWDLFANAHYKSSVCPIKIADGKGMRFKMPKPLELLFYWI